MQLLTTSKRKRKFAGSTTVANALMVLTVSLTINVGSVVNLAMEHTSVIRPKVVTTIIPLEVVITIVTIETARCPQQRLSMKIKRIT